MWSGRQWRDEGRLQWTRDEEDWSLNSPRAAGVGKGEEEEEEEEEEEMKKAFYTAQDG